MQFQNHHGTVKLQAIYSIHRVKMIMLLSSKRSMYSDSLWYNCCLDSLKLKRHGKITINSSD